MAMSQKQVYESFIWEPVFKSKIKKFFKKALKFLYQDSIEEINFYKNQKSIADAPIYLASK